MLARVFVISAVFLGLFLIKSNLFFQIKDSIFTLHYQNGFLFDCLDLVVLRFSLNFCWVQ